MARIRILRGLLLLAQLVISASYSTETSERELSHSGACDPPTVDTCVLPVNANISLSNTGVGGMTDVHVSIEIYANNHSSVAPAIWHHPKELISTIVRVILPEGFKICQEQNRILSTLQGGPQGVRGVTGAGGFRQELAVAKGRITTEVAPGVIERTGREIGQADPCQPLCMDRVFEMETFHTCDENDPSTPDGGDTDDCRPTSSREPSKPTLLTFTISNVRSPEKRTRNTDTGVDGELESSGQYGITQFGIQIYKKFIEVRNEQKIARLTMRYYNNRINDRMLNHTIFPWFDRTSNVPVVLTENRLWLATVSFESPIKSTETSAVIHITLNSAVPREGFIRIVFPDSFDVSPTKVVSVEVWRRVVSTSLFRSLSEVRDGLYEDRNDKTLHPLWCDDTQTSYCKFANGLSKRTASSGKMYKIVDGKLFVMFQESGTESDYNPVQSERTYHFFHYEPQAKRTNLTMLVQRTPIARNSELMIIVKQIRTPERHESGKFIVLTGSENASSVLHDSREAASVPLGPNLLQNPSIMLSERKAGAENVVAKFSFETVNRMAPSSTILVRLPVTDFLFENGAHPTLNKTSGDSDLSMDVARTRFFNHSGSEYVEFTLRVADGTPQGNGPTQHLATIKFSIGGFTNRRFAGPSTEDVLIETRGGEANWPNARTKTNEREVLDRGRFRLNQNVLPSMLDVRSVEFPRSASGLGDIAVTFSVLNPVSEDSQIILRFSSLFQISHDTQLKLGQRSLVKDDDWNQTKVDDPALGKSLALPMGVDGYRTSEITIYRRRSQGAQYLAKGDVQSIVLTNVRSPNVVVTPQLEVTTLSFVHLESVSDKLFEIDTAIANATLMLPAFLLGATVSLSSNQAGKLQTSTVRFTTNNVIDANGRVAVEFPVDFDVSAAHMSPDLLKTTLNRSDCDAQLQCQGNVSFIWNATKNQWMTKSTFSLSPKEKFTFTYRGFGFDGSFETSISDPAECLYENVNGSCRAMVLTLTRRERLLSAVQSPAMYTLEACSMKNFSNCSQMCNAAINITENCTRLVNESFWTNLTVPASPIPAMTFLELPIRDVRNPRYSGNRVIGRSIERKMTGSFAVRTTLPLPHGLAVDGNDEIDAPDLVPVILSNTNLELADTRAFADTTVTLSFNMSNPLLDSHRISVLFPKLSRFRNNSNTQSVQIIDQTNAKMDEDFIFTCEGCADFDDKRDLLILTKPSGGLAASSLIMNLGVKNRPYAEGDTGPWSVKTMQEAFPSDWRVVEEFTFDPLPITTAEFREFSITVKDYVSKGKPIAGKPLFVKVTLRVNQEIAYPSGKFILKLGNGIVLRQDEISVKFDCDGTDDGTTERSCSADTTNDLCSWIETAAELSEAGQVLTLARRQWSLLTPARGALAPTNQQLAFEIHGATARKTAGLMSKVSIEHQGVTDAGLASFELNELSQYTYNEIDPCVLEDGQLKLSHNVSAQADVIDATFTLCHDLPAGDLIGFVFENGFFGCNQYQCDAFDQAAGFYVNATSSVVVEESNVANITFHSYTQGTGFALMVPEFIAEGTRIQVTVSGITNPVARNGSRAQIIIETQHVSRAPYGRAMPPRVPQGGFTSSSSPVHFVTFAPSFTSSFSFLSGVIMHSSDLSGTIKVTLPQGFSSIGSNLELVNMSFNGTSLIGNGVSFGSGMVNFALPQTIPAGMPIRFRVQGIINSPYAHPQRRLVDMMIGSKNLEVDGFHLQPVALTDVAYGAVVSTTNSSSDLTFSMTLASEMNISNTSIEVHLNAAFTELAPAASVHFNPASLSSTDPLASLQVPVDFNLAWIEKDGLRYAMAMNMTRENADAGHGSFRLTLSAKTQTIQQLEPTLQACHHSLPVSSCRKACVHGNVTAGVVARLANCTNSSRSSVNKYSSATPLSIPAGSRVGFSVSGYGTPRMTGDYDASIYLVVAGSKDVMQQGTSSLNPILKPRPISTKTEANFTIGTNPSPARIRERANITVKFDPDNEIPVGSQIKAQFPTGETGFMHLEAVTEIQVDSVTIADWTYSSVGSYYLIPLPSQSLPTTSELTIRFIGAEGVRVPVFPGPSSGITLTSSLMDGNREMEVAYVAGSPISTHFASASVAPLNSARRFGSSVDTRGENYLDVTFRIGSPLLADGGFVIGFPSAYRKPDIGCKDARGILACVSNVSCILGCDGTLSVQPDVTLAPLTLGSDSNGNAVYKHFDLNVTRNGDGSRIEAGTSITLRLFDFSVPQFNASLPAPAPCANVDSGWSDSQGRNCDAYSQNTQLCGFEESVFRCCNCSGGGDDDGFTIGALAAGYLAEWRAVPDFQPTVSLLQGVSNNSCSGMLKQPEITLEEWGAGMSNSWFKTILFRTTNEVLAGGIISIEFQSDEFSKMDETKMVHGGTLQAEFARCAHRDSCHSKEVTFNISCSTASNGQSCSSASSVRLTMQCPDYIGPDEIVGFFDVCSQKQTNTDGDQTVTQTVGLLTNKLMAESLSVMRITTQTAWGFIIDSQNVQPAYCRDGVPTVTTVQENDVSQYFKVDVTSSVAGQRSDMTLSIQSLPNGFPALPVKGYALVYLPRLFIASTNYSLPPPAPRTQSLPATTVQAREEIPVINTQELPTGPLQYQTLGAPEQYADTRTVLKFDLTQTDNSVTRKLDIILGAVRNPDFALGYPPAKGNNISEQLRLVVRVFSTSAEDASGPMFWAESQPLIVPEELSDITVDPPYLKAAASVPTLKMRFRTQTAIPARATFAVRMPKSIQLGSMSKLMPESESSAITGSLESHVMIDDSTPYLDIPGQCTPSGGSGSYDLGSYCNDTRVKGWREVSNCRADFSCEPSPATEASYKIVAKRITKITNETYIVPELCAVPGLQTIEPPGSWILPAGCDITLPYQNVTIQMERIEEPSAIVKGSFLTIFLLNFRAPLEYGIEPLLDVQVLSDAFEAYPDEWLISRHHRVSLGSVTTGAINDIAVSLIDTTSSHISGYVISSQSVSGLSNITVGCRISGDIAASSKIIFVLHQELVVDDSVLHVLVSVTCHDSSASTCPPHWHLIACRASHGHQLLRGILAEQS